MRSGEQKRKVRKKRRESKEKREECILRAKARGIRKGGKRGERGGKRKGSGEERCVREKESTGNHSHKVRTVSLRGKELKKRKSRIGIGSVIGDKNIWKGEYKEVFTWSLLRGAMTHLKNLY